jgi:phage terminase small subunit
VSLTPKQERFVEEYLLDLNATQAAIRAGYSARTAYSQGQRLLKNAELQDAIAKAQANRSNRTGITQDMVLSELAKIGFSDIRKAIRWASNVAVAAPDERTLDQIMEDGPGEVRHALTNQVELIDSDAIDDDTAAAIAEIAQTDRGGLKVKLHDKRAALVDIGKHLGMFKERIEHTGKDGKDLPSPTIAIFALPDNKRT